jgi:hypothetical protein
MLRIALQVCGQASGARAVEVEVPSVRANGGT